MTPSSPSTMTTASTTQRRRKGLAKVLRLVEHKNIAIIEVTQDPENEDFGKESMLFFNKTKQSWMCEYLELGDVVGIELPLKQGRGPDLITWALPTYAQPESVQKLEPGHAQITEDELVDSVVDTETSKRVTGRLRDPRTEKAFDKFMADRGLTQTEAVDVAIRTGLINLGYQA